MADSPQSETLLLGMALRQAAVDLLGFDLDARSTPYVIRFSERAAPVVSTPTAAQSEAGRWMGFVGLDFWVRVDDETKPTFRRLVRRAA